jgi:hypothetical protein
VTVIDNFATCDEAICNLGGRSGNWFTFATADINQAFAVSAPPSGFVDRACAAWSTGGPKSGVTVTQTYAGIGLQLAVGAGYDLSGYTGVIVSMESGQGVHFVVNDTSNHLFGAEMSGGGSGAQSYTIPFSSLTALTASAAGALNLKQVVQLEFDSDMPTAYGFAIYSVSLYP